MNVLLIYYEYSYYCDAFYRLIIKRYCDDAHANNELLHVKGVDRKFKKKKKKSMYIYIYLKEEKENQLLFGYNRQDG